ncbi:MAG: PIN domain-containing protein [Acidobacteriota bacterium]|nr:PIN domain-containing protein [Acidobacteriota bacterium]
MKYRLYLDNCCFNRPYDDQSKLSIHLESEAKLFIQKEILNGKFELVWSYILDYENLVNPYEQRKNAIAAWRSIAVIDIDESEEIILTGNGVMLKGLKKKDALHIACAIKANCDYFLTTDKKLLNKELSEIVLINPLDFVSRMEV